MTRLTYSLKTTLTASISFFLLSIACNSQPFSKHIVVDQFGYPTVSPKIAIIRNPILGYDSAESFYPGEKYALVDSKSGAHVLESSPEPWRGGAVDSSSGDQVWHFDFTSVQQNGEYYVLDINKNVRSYEFTISPDVYNEVLKQAFRVFYYQRVGFAKKSPFAEKPWEDEASHIGPLQDKQCRKFDEPDNPATERDLSGGWYDAGDYNKYTNWTANYIVEMMKAYTENPSVWTDDCNIPESKNGIPDLMDEAKWGIDHLLRLQQEDGSFLSIVDEDEASPPSAAKKPSYYGPANTSAALNCAGALAYSAKVFRTLGMKKYAKKLLKSAVKGWEWADANPDVIFKNNSEEFNSKNIGAGQQEENDYQRLMSKIEAAVFLFYATGDVKYGRFVEQNFRKSNLIIKKKAHVYETPYQDALLFYTTCKGSQDSVSSVIKESYRSSILSGKHNFPAHDSIADPYLSYIASYNWGSNCLKSFMGGIIQTAGMYGFASKEKVRALAIGYIHYIHGVNPLNLTYLTNMSRFGAENSVNEIYHNWFKNGSAKWDRVGTSLYGPPPGFLAGGANPRYNWDRCCPDNCGTEENNAKCLSETISPPLNQPDQKSYKDFNNSWPLNSWSISENSNLYQIAYLRLLSKYAIPIKK